MPTAIAADEIVRVLRLVEPSVPVAGWAVEPEAYPVLTPSTESLDRIVATLADGRDLRVFVKTIRSMRHWPLIGMLPEADRTNAIERFPWRTEADVYASSLVRDLPDGLRAPRIHAIDDLGDDRVRIWMEDLAGPAVTWDAGRYEAAARRLGRLAGRTHRNGLPGDAPPLSGGLRLVHAMRIDNFLIPALRSEETWRHPLMAAVARADGDLRRDLLELADEASAILGSLDGLPHGLAHGDACPQNLLPDPERGDDLVAIDWGFTNLAPLGSDLGQLLVGLAEGGDLEADELPAISDVIFPAYLEGIHDEGVAVRADDVRHGYLGSLLVGKTFSALPLERLGGPIDAAAEAGFLRRGRYARYLLGLRAALPPIAA